MVAEIFCGKGVSGQAWPARRSSLLPGFQSTAFWGDSVVAKMVAHIGGDPKPSCEMEFIGEGDVKFKVCVP